jgi:segregation and condensation protein A
MTYKVKIAEFEGPLDLLLHLIREQKLDIKTMRLADITGQYLEYLEDIHTLDLDLAAEFIEVAATLIEIKARGILPKPTQQTDPEEDERRILKQLEEYKILKDAAAELKKTENIDRFYKDPAELKPEYKFILDNLSLDALTAAFQKIMHRRQKNTAQITAKQVRMDRFTVQEKMEDIRKRLGLGGNDSPRTPRKTSLKFFSLFEEDFTKSEMINTFLALLELLKVGEIRANQPDMFGDIAIEVVQ